MSKRTALLAVALVAVAACKKLDSVPQDAIQDCSASQVFAGHVATDILFVVDDSGSMGEEQANLASNLGTFIDRLASLPIEDDYQIGVTTTDVDDFGGGTNFAGGPEQGYPYPRGAIVAVAKDAAGNGIPGNFVWDPTNRWAAAPLSARILTKGSQTLIQDFKANVRVGTYGSGKEQPYRAIRMALTDRVADGTNAGFLRPGAKLAIVILSDEDDCSDTAGTAATTNSECHTLATKQSSLDPVAEFASFLASPIESEQRDVVVGAIVGVAPGTLDVACATPGVCGTPPPSCTSCCATAYDTADRDTWLLQALGPARTRLASICDTSFAKALEDLATAIMSDTMPLDGAPADWRMLVAKVTKPTGATTSCRIASAAESSAGDIALADAIYTPPQMGGPSLTFQGACALSPGDRVDLAVICAR